MHFRKCVGMKTLYPNLYDNTNNLLHEYFRDPLVKW